MTKLEFAVSIITAICLIGVIFLIYVERETAVLLPVLTALVGWLIGKKEQIIMGAFKSKKKK